MTTTAVTLTLATVAVALAVVAAAQAYVLARIIGVREWTIAYRTAYRDALDDFERGTAREIPPTPAAVDDIACDALAGFRRPDDTQPMAPLTDPALCPHPSDERSVIAPGATQCAECGTWLPTPTPDQAPALRDPLAGSREMFTPDQADPYADWFTAQRQLEMGTARV